LGDLTRRRGHINALETKDSAVIVNAQVPLAEMFGYATAIRSLSKGRASYSMEPLRFDPLPVSLAEKILDSAQDRPPARA
jgi:elongation factor G